MARARRMHERASTINGNLITGKRKISMSSKPKRIEITKPQATFTQSGTEEVSVGNSACDEEIRRRAYEIYLERGEQPGRDLDDLAPSRTRTRARGTLARAGGLAKGSATSADIGTRGAIRTLGYSLCSWPWD